MKFNFINAFDIKQSTDQENTVKEISENVSLRGYNLWILACAAILASLGLDTNSVAVIIGAMLISPLMSPILGVGLSLGINDRELLYKSFRNLLLATLLSLLCSFIYFLLTPLGEATPEILARTRPTLLDVLVAFFGGVAGIVSGSRNYKTNAIPGVAIATALMPPLCTAGFGLATGEITVFLGAFYLFFINAVFISLSTYLIVKYLEFTPKSYIDKNLQGRVRRVMAFLLLLVIAPSIYFLYNTYEETQDKKMIEAGVISDLRKKGNEIIKWEIQPSDTTGMIKVYYSGKDIDKDSLMAYENLLKQYDLTDYRLKLIRINLSKDEILQLSSQATKEIMNNLELQASVQKHEQLASDSLVEERSYKKIGSELKIIYPELKSLSIGEVNYYLKDSTFTIPSVILNFEGRQSQSRMEEVEKKLADLLKVRLDKDSVLVVVRK